VRHAIAEGVTDCILIRQKTIGYKMSYANYLISKE
jgi:hypothetical protein